MHLINLIINSLYRKYGVPLHNFFENWTRGTSQLNWLNYEKCSESRTTLSYYCFSSMHLTMK